MNKYSLQFITISKDGFIIPLVLLVRYYKDGNNKYQRG